jgi:hypothetical protein
MVKTYRITLFSILFRRLFFESDSTLSDKFLRLFPSYRRRQLRARNERMNGGFCR